MKPIFDRIIVLPDPAQEKTDSGIFLPEGVGNPKEHGYKGTVQKAGKLCKEVEEGDRIIYGKYAGTAIVDNGVELLIMKESDVFCIL